MTLSSLAISRQFAEARPKSLDRLQQRQIATSYLRSMAPCNSRALSISMSRSNGLFACLHVCCRAAGFETTDACAADSRGAGGGGGGGGPGARGARDGAESLIPPARFAMFALPALAASCVRDPSPS